MRRTTSLLLCLLLIESAAAAEAATRHVRMTGSDTNNTTCALATPCATLKHAVEVAADGDTILLGKGTFLQTGDAFVNKELLIEGNGALTSRVFGTPQWGASRLLTVGVKGVVTLRNLQLGKGVADLGGAIRNHGALEMENVWVRQNQASQGGGIYNDGQLSMREVEVGLNNGVGGIVNSPQGSLLLVRSRVAANRGGGILNFGTLTMRRSIVAANVARNDVRSSFGGDGVLSHGGEVQIVNSTISGNRGYGVAALTQAHVELTHATVADNSIGLNADGNATVLLANTIVSGNVKTDCMTGGGHVSGVTSLVGVQCLTWPTVDNLIGVDAKLAALAPNGYGLAWTHALRAGSPAIDAAGAEHCAQVDQRGIARPNDGDGDGFAACDIGAFELVPPATGRGGTRR